MKRRETRGTLNPHRGGEITGGRAPTCTTIIAYYPMCESAWPLTLGPSIEQRLVDSGHDVSPAFNPILLMTLPNSAAQSTLRKRHTPHYSGRYTEPMRRTNFRASILTSILRTMVGKLSSP